jgi:hypothetical protein
MEPLRTVGSNWASIGGRVVRLGGLSINIGVAPEFTPGDNCARPGPPFRCPNISIVIWYQERKFLRYGTYHLEDRTDHDNNRSAEAELAALGVMLGIHHLPGPENDES